MAGKSKLFIQVLIGCTTFYLLATFYVNFDDENISEVRPMALIKSFVGYTKAKDENNLVDVYVVPLSEEILDYHRRLNLTNPGHLGAAVVLGKSLPEDIQGEIDQSNSEFKFNEFVSRLIPLDRELRDMRQGTCMNATYLSELPKASIILAFYNEPFSMMMRTIYSILKRSPPELIEEIILVDDCSDKDSVLQPLHEVVPRLPKVRIVRSPTRLGLMRARILGVTSAKGPVVIVMDSHVEVAIGWLPPLLDPIARDPNTITLPGVETLEPQSLKYENVIQDKYNWVGGFTWEMMYTWIMLPRPNRSETPLPSPTMLGAAFAIRKDYFEYLGYYDDGFELWGGENLELSFKVWMCGGQMFQAFCSHVGHMFRARPYWDDSSDSKMRRNTDRLAEVWLDEYKKYYVSATNKFFKKNATREFGDVSAQKELRKKLNCKPFKWFYETFYKTQKLPY